jgi:hypothetical protein
MEYTDAELADAIVSLVGRKYPRLKLTEEDICEMVFGHGFYRRQVNGACRRLVALKRLDRGGKGVAYDPFWYRPWYPPADRRI